MAAVVRLLGRTAPGPAGTDAGAVQRRRRADLSLALRTTPGRLWLLLLASLALCLLWGIVATSTAVRWTAAANPVVASVGPLSYDAQQAYRSLSDAYATEANAYLSGIAQAATTTRIHGDISRAEADIMAIQAGQPGPAVQADLTTLATGIAAYTNLVGEADALNREQVPVGAAWLGDASNLMHGALLPAASRLHQQENARLSAAYGQAGMIIAAVLMGACCVAGVGRHIAGYC